MSKTDTLKGKKMAKRWIEFFGSSPNAFGNNLRAEQNVTDGPMFQGEKGQLFLHDLGKNFLQSVEQIQKDPKLTREGQTHAMGQVAKRLLAQLRREYRRFLDPITVAYQKAQSSPAAPALQAKTDPAERIGLMELRTYLRSLGGEERRRVFDEALGKSDDRILACYFQDSDIYQLLGEDIIAAGRKKYLMKRAPETVEAEEAGSVLVDNIQHVVDDLSLYVTGASEDAAAIHSELPRLSWSFEASPDYDAIRFNQSVSSLPGPTARVVSEVERANLLKEEADS